MVDIKELEEKVQSMRNWRAEIDKELRQLDRQLTRAKQARKNEMHRIFSLYTYPMLEMLDSQLPDDYRVAGFSVQRHGGNAFNISIESPMDKLIITTDDDGTLVCRRSSKGPILNSTEYATTVATATLYAAEQTFKHWEGVDNESSL